MHLLWLLSRRIIEGNLLAPGDSVYSILNTPVFQEAWQSNKQILVSCWKNFPLEKAQGFSAKLRSPHRVCSVSHLKVDTYFWMLLRQRELQTQEQPSSG